MFFLFFSLYYSMFKGSWTLYSNSELNTMMTSIFTTIGKLLTSIFGDVSYNTLGSDISSTMVLQLVAYVLALITSIGIVVMAVKGVKKAFGIFFMGIRR